MDCCEFKASLAYIARYRPVCALQSKALSRTGEEGEEAEEKERTEVFLRK